jgi:uncharacterized membrane protein
MKPVTVSTTIDKPREEVYDFLEPLPNHEQFTDHVLTEWQVFDEGRRVIVKVDAPGPKQTAEIQALEEERPSRLVERTTARGGKRKTIGTYRLTDAPGGGTRVEFEIAWEQAPFSDRLTAPLGRAWLQKANQKAMDRLKELLESGAA